MVEAMKKYSNEYGRIKANEKYNLPEEALTAAHFYSGYGACLKECQVEELVNALIDLTAVYVSEVRLPNKKILFEVQDVLLKIEER